jgi:branched-chain amino acid transport system substrate-binding protein
MRLRFVSLWLVLMFLMVLSSCTAVVPPQKAAPPPSFETKGDSLFQEAETNFNRQDYRQAWQAYAAYLRRYPQGPHANRALLREAELLGIFGNWQGSLAKYQGILNRGTGGDTALEARYGIGRAYFKLGRYEAAEGALQSLTASPLPGSLRFSTNALLTEIALKKGQVESAFMYLRLAAQHLAAGDQEWFSYLQTRVVEQASPAELEHLANLYRDSPLTAPLLLRLARLAQEQKHPAEARQWLQALKERFPESREAQTAKDLISSRPIIGCLLPLSGHFARYGLRVKQGMELAAQGSPLELKFLDCSNNPYQTTRSVQKLSQDPGVLALLGPLTSGDAQAAAQAAQDSGIPLIALSQKQNLTEGRPLIFQVFLTPRLQVRALLRYTLGERGLKRYAVFSPDSAYGRAMARVFSEEVVAQGGILVTQAVYPPGTRDFTLALSPLLTAFQHGTEGVASFGALFIPDDAVTVAAIAGQTAQSPLGKVQLLGTNLAKPRQNSPGTTQALEGILFPDAFFNNDPNPAVQNFVAAYRQHYGTEPDYLAAQGYMVVRLVRHLLEGQTPVTRKDLPQKLMSLRDIPNLPWFKGFAPDRQAELALYILTIKNGRVEMATSPAAGQP